MHVTLKLDARVFQEVNKSTLLDELVFLGNANIFHLLFSVNQMLHLELFNGISPLVTELLGLVARVNVVENRELGSQHESEMLSFNVTNVPSKEELVMEDHSTEPFVVRPTSESRQSSNRADVSEEEDKSTSATGERLVMGRNLLGSNGLEESSHVVVVSIN